MDQMPISKEFNSAPFLQLLDDKLHVLRPVASAYENHIIRIDYDNILQTDSGDKFLTSLN